MNPVSDDRVQLEFSMSDPTNPYPSSPSPEQPAYGQQAPQGQPAYGQQAYGQQAYGAPMDVVTDVQGARSAAKICTIIHGVIIAVFLVFVIIIPIIIALTEAGSGAFS